MGRDKWVEAAQKLAGARKKPENKVGLEKRILEEAGRLNGFLSSEDGEAALLLLRRAKKHIIFGERADNGYAEVCFINGIGLLSSSSGMWVAYVKGVPQPKISSITPEVAVRMAVYSDFNKKKPEEVLSWLKSELDKIADEVINRKK